MAHNEENVTIHYFATSGKYQNVIEGTSRVYIVQISMIKRCSIVSDKIDCCLQSNWLDIGTVVIIKATRIMATGQWSAALYLTFMTKLSDCFQRATFGITT